MPAACNQAIKADVLLNKSIAAWGGPYRFSPPQINMMGWVNEFTEDVLAYCQVVLYLLKHCKFIPFHFRVIIIIIIEENTPLQRRCKNKSMSMH